jgi:hypothetical protein
MSESSSIPLPSHILSLFLQDSGLSHSQMQNYFQRNLLFSRQRGFTLYTQWSILRSCQHHRLSVLYSRPARPVARRQLVCPRLSIMLPVRTFEIIKKFFNTFPGKAEIERRSNIENLCSVCVKRHMLCNCFVFKRILKIANP